MGPRERKRGKPAPDNSYKSSQDVKSKVPLKKSRTHLSYGQRIKTMISTTFNKQLFSNLIFSPNYLWVTACIFLLLEAALNIFIIENVPYTEIDWVAYMQEVKGFLNGTWDYTELKGDTGPLVYPAGFLYIFSILYYITDHGRNIKLGQYIFAVFYIVTLSLVFRIYHKSKKLPPYILIFVCCISYRVHSIYVLRLFNDPIAMMILYGAINCFISGKWTTGSVLFSLAVSVKMNILLFSPALLMAYFYALGLKKTFFQLVICASIQVMLALPFLITNPVGYLQRAFDLGRIFLFEWTVNWRFLPEDIFVDKYFHLCLLGAHILVVVVFALFHWKRMLKHYGPLQSSKLEIGCQLFLLPLFMSNFIGIVFSRSLHYQFYIWYFHSLPYLLWSTSFSISMRLLILGLIELCWNTYPSTILSSILLHFCHVTLLVGLFNNRPTGEKVQAIKRKLIKGN